MKSAAGVFLLLTLPVQAPPLTLGPYRGHVDSTSMHVFARAGAAGDYVLHLAAVVDGSEGKATASAVEAHDLTLHFVVEGLEPGAAYVPWITCGEHTVLPRGGIVWATAAGDDAARATIAFGSCSNDLTFKEQPIWGQLLARAPEALVLLGDTPYIDDGSTDGRRRRYRQFLGFPPVQAALMVLPTWTTWDDHDYASNDAFGAAKGSETARAVFVDYHAHAGFGDGERGIYTRFRRGPVEVFLLDTRSFADGGPSPLATGERTLLGEGQLAWLQAGLRASTAPCKVLAGGMVWNQGVRPNKADCWGNWLPERDALLRWLGSAGIEGVVLLSGDVHRSRVILHPTRELAGYDVPEFVTSPLAQNVLESNAVPVPGLVFDAGEAHSALLLTVDVAPAPPAAAHAGG
ncbi:MAG: alkaline phosphatase family protein, partial [Planctomycetes bacterium]|nr:alkaline phosphatase family protein [Planctomycetota bacterium]